MNWQMLTEELVRDRPRGPVPERIVLGGVRALLAIFVISVLAFLAGRVLVNEFLDSVMYF